MFSLNPRICTAEVFLVCEVKREDLFELLCKHNNEFRNARSKTKIQGLSVRRHNRAASSLPHSCLFKKDGRKDFRLCETIKH
jgi:hypothetical protein